MDDLFSYSPPPVAIGGIGGSGTRLVCDIFKSIGFSMGSVLNPSNDNILFSVLFKNLSILDLDTAQFLTLYQSFSKISQGLPLQSAEINLLTAAIHSNDLFPEHWKQQVLALMHEKPQAISMPWGWKEPNTHRVIERIHEVQPDIKFIYVRRIGLDMAFSSNQNQLKLWGPQVLGRPVEISPRDSLSYWCATQQRMDKVQEKMGSSYFDLDYDTLCLQPEKIIAELFRFIGKSADKTVINTLSLLVKPPKSMGRYKNKPLDIFRSADIEYLTDRFGLKMAANHLI
ncbi:MAG: sulfotransferase [Cellvibrionales bacterium]|nr:sulfotransferase [Cellvibrionales bacterium]